MVTMVNPDSDIDEIRRELALLQVAHEALLRSYQRLALKALGDTPETAVFLGEIRNDISEHFPEWMK
jgi:hypothetical protein